VIRSLLALNTLQLLQADFNAYMGVAIQTIATLVKE